MFRILTTMLVVGLVSCNANPSMSRPPKVKGHPGEIWVMIIDTGVGKHDKLTNVQYKESDDYVDNHGHGTHVAGIVEYGSDLSQAQPSQFDDKLCSNVKIFSCKYYDPKFPLWDTLQRSTDCVNKATELGMDYINYSGGGATFNDKEYEAYRRYSLSGGTAVVAAGNEGSNMIRRPYYPASYAFEDGFTEWRKGRLTRSGERRFTPLRLHVVMNEDRRGRIHYTSNSHPRALRAVGVNVLSTLPNNQYGTLTGTSQAAPAVLHLILRQRCVELSAKKIVNKLCRS